MHTEWAPNSEPLPGYRLIERLGQGGFAEVWKASAPGGILKAIKLVYGNMAPEGGQAPGHAAQELKSLARVREVRNPFILSVERVEILDGQLVVVTELADRNLSDRLKECQRQGMVGISRSELLQYLREAAEALDLMGSQYQLLHLDIKPDNLLLVGNHLKIGDFGLVKDLQGTSASVTYGLTPMYAAPETFDGRAYRSSDQYSLAIVYQEMLTGSRPFPGRSPREVLLQHLTSEPNLQALPEADRPIVAKALAKDPKQRYESCGQFIDALIRAAPSETLSLAAMSTQPTTWLAKERDVTPNLSETSSVHTCEPIDQGESVTMRRLNLAPALVIGVGGIGIECLGRLHGVIEERIGQRPAIRYLAIDCDLGVLPQAEGLGLETKDVLVCPLQKPAHYLERWEQLKQRFHWMDANGLFKIGRSGGPEGQRALGRLALVDHYGVVHERIASAIAQLTESAGAPPRVYLVAAMGGGTATGMFVDLCYMARRALCRGPWPQVVGVFFAGVNDEHPHGHLHRVNHLALMRDLAELSKPDAVFQPPPGDEGPTEAIAGPPLDALYVFDAGPKPVEPKVKDSTVAAISRFVADHAASELGPKLEAFGQRQEWPAVRPIGVFSVTYPRRALIRQSAARLARATLSCWLEPIGEHEADVHGEYAVTTLAPATVEPGQLSCLLREEAVRHLGEPLEMLVQHRIDPLKDELAGAKAADQIERTRCAMDDLDRLLGCDPAEQRSILPEESRLERALRAAACRLVDRLSVQLFQVVQRVMDQPGRKLAKGRSAANGLVRMLAAQREQERPAVQSAAQQTRQNAAAIRDRLVDLSLADGSASVAPLALIELLQQYGAAKIQTQLAHHVELVYGGLIGALTRRLDDIDLGSRRLASLLKALPESSAPPVESVAAGSWVRAIYPSGTVNAGDPCGSIADFASQADEFEQYLLETVFQPLGGLWATLDLRNRFDVNVAGELDRHTADWVARSYSATDVAACLLARYVANERGLCRELRAMYEAADPLAPRPRRRPFDPSPASKDGLFVTAPATQSGLRFIEAARQALPEASLEPVFGPEHCAIYRITAAPAGGFPSWLADAESDFQEACNGRLAPNVLAVCRRPASRDADPNPEPAPPDGPAEMPASTPANSLETAIPATSESVANAADVPEAALAPVA